MTLSTVTGKFLDSAADRTAKARKGFVTLTTAAGAELNIKTEDMLTVMEESGILSNDFDIVIKRTDYERAIGVDSKVEFVTGSMI